MSKFDIKEKIDDGIYSIFNYASDLLLQFDHRSRVLLKNNEKYRNQHAGRRCFILGTGPSLNKLAPEQIDKLSDEITFAVNSIYKVPQLEKISPSYYSLLDNNYWGVASHTFTSIAQKYTEHPPIIITDIRAKAIIPRQMECIYLYAKHYPISQARFDITKNLSITMNVVGFSVLCAIFMGFKEVYLLGCDYNLFCTRIGTHCYNDEDEINELPQYNLGFYLKYYHLTTKFHYLIAKLAKDMGVQVINATEGSLLDAYPHKRIQSLL